MGTARNSNWLVVGDPLRGVAAFGVLLYHASMSGALTGPHPAPIGFAGRILFNLDAGVFLFFALSGYLIGRPFASAFVLGTPFPNVARFLLKRVRRLAPGMIAATLLGLAVFGTVGGDATVHFWTLYAEGVFYVVLPFAALLAVAGLTRVRAGLLRGPRRRAALWVAAAIGVALASLAFRAQGSVSDVARQQLFAGVAFAFTPGLVLAGLEPVVRPRVRLDRILLVAGLTAVAAYFAVPRANFVAHAAAAGAASGLILAAAVVRAWSGAPPWRALDNRPLQWLGERSSSLYLFHVAVVHGVTVGLLGGVDATGARVALVAAASVPLSLVAAWIGYALVERPFTSGEVLAALKPNAARIVASPVER